MQNHPCRGAACPTPRRQKKKMRKERPMLVGRHRRPLFKIVDPRLPPGQRENTALSQSRVSIPALSLYLKYSLHYLSLHTSMVLTFTRHISFLPVPFPHAAAGRPAALGRTRPSLTAVSPPDPAGHKYPQAKRLEDGQPLG